MCLPGVASVGSRRKVTLAALSLRSLCALAALTFWCAQDAHALDSHTRTRSSRAPQLLHVRMHPWLQPRLSTCAMR
eukprot:361570-Chlamydomonas_euryale.AAC.10